MEKKLYEGYKNLMAKVENNTANFKERNIWNIIQKKKAKGKSYFLKEDNSNSFHRYFN
jgi:hypothetical protein